MKGSFSGVAITKRRGTFTTLGVDCKKKTKKESEREGGTNPGDRSQKLRRD